MEMQFIIEKLEHANVFKLDSERFIKPEEIPSKYTSRNMDEEWRAQARE